MIAAFAAAALVVPATAAPRQDAHAAIMAAMADSAAGWTAGDLGGFMAVYADEATFVVGDGVIRGKAAIAARYAPRFSGDRAAKRGALTFEEIDFRLIDPSHALLLARYRLKIDGAADQAGPTSLLFEKKRGAGWKIVADHSS
jgi:uncharacterized protein (TIGR02246 family)